VKVKSFLRLSAYCFYFIGFTFFSFKNVQCDESGKYMPIKAGILNIDALAGGKVEESIEFKALRRIFQGLGISFDVIKSTSNLSNYKLVCTGGNLLNNALPAEAVNDLYAYVEDGGTLLSAGEIGKIMYPLFGVKKHLPGRRRYRMSFVGNDTSLRYIDNPNEKTISLGNGESHYYDDVIWSHGYELEDEALLLARFDDDSAGFLLNDYGRGKTYLLGLSYIESVLFPQIGRDYEAQRRFANTFEPSCDVIMLIIRAIYESIFSPSVYLSTIPYGLSTGLILTHDVDAQTSFIDSLKFADLEESYGVKSTFFENTKYFTDSMDIGYYSIEENIEAIRELKRRGWDIGSHTVSHYKKFSRVPEGDPNVTVESYNPRKNITVYGEVVVSKNLLDRDIPDQVTIAFRAGDLEFPNSLIRILEKAGYFYDSTFASGDVLTSFPYFALNERKPDSKESNVIEIPVTLDDSMGFLTPDNFQGAVQQWLEITQANRQNEAITVLLIHPSDTRDKDYKLKAQEILMNEVLKMGGWMGDLTSFGEFWRERHRTKFNVQIQNGSLIIVVDTKKSELHPAVGFVVGNTEMKRVIVKTIDGKVLPFRVKERDGKLYVGREWKH